MRIHQRGRKAALHKRLRRLDGKKTGRPCFIAALGTPLDKNEDLHEEGLGQLLERQWAAGIHGVLVGGTMGVMQLLRDDTYRRLVQRGVEMSRGQGEVLVGCGDTSLGRTREKIEFLNRFRVDGVVALSPYFIPFGQEELFDYYRGLADLSRHPLYLYEIPCRTGVRLEHDTVERLAEHPNVRGIKCSCEWEWTEELIRRLDDRLRIIVVQLERMDAMLRQGVMEHLDGVFSLMPSWTTEIGRAAEADDWRRAEAYRRRVVHVQGLLRRFGSFQTATALWNAQGVPGNFAPAPMRPLTADQQRLLFEDPVVREKPH